MSGKSIHYDAMVSLQAIIKAIGLEGISSAPIIQDVLNYVDKSLPKSDTGQYAPCVLIAPWGPEKPHWDEGVVNRDMIVCPVVIVTVAGAGADDIGTTLEQRMQWRQQIRRRIQNRALDGTNNSIAVPYNYTVTCETLPVVDVHAWVRDQKHISGLIANCIFQEPRE